MEVTSEIYDETDFSSVKCQANGNVISKFKFNMPGNSKQSEVEKDEDEDLLVPRKGRSEFIEIEHKKSTVLNEVGLQVWRGALLINDFILENRELFSNKTILEVGSGVGISSIVASIYAKKVICTDINIGGILDLIKRNVELNKTFQRHKNNVEVLELNFLDERYNVKLEEELKYVNIVLAADVIYDNTITEGFIQTIIKLFKMSPVLSEFYIALEKRFVFTDSVCAPMYEHFIDNFKTDGFLKLSEVPTKFTQYFEYDRCKELILLKVTRT